MIFYDLRKAKHEFGFNSMFGQKCLESIIVDACLTAIAITVGKGANDLRDPSSPFLTGIRFYFTNPADTLRFFLYCCTVWEPFQTLMMRHKSKWYIKWRAPCCITSRWLAKRKTGEIIQFIDQAIWTPFKLLSVRFTHSKIYGQMPLQ